MSLTLTSSRDLHARKELTRLRMEMHRQQLRYHAQPLRKPFEHVKGFVGSGHRLHNPVGGKGPVLLLSTALLALFGKRLGKLGTVARLGLTLYPLLKMRQQLHHH